jgi:PKD repeat protein
MFSILILAVSLWQAQVIPQQNESVEYTHNQRVQDDMKDVRTVLVSAPGERSIRSVSVDMAPAYPPRSVFVNPGPPAGTLRTVGTGNGSLNVTVNNATAVDDGETADFWTGAPRSYDTGGLVYEPNYNVYTEAPVTVYENSVLYNSLRSGANVTLAGQDLIDGRTITLVALNGSLARTTSDTYTVDPKRLSSSTRSITITNTSGNVTVSFASRRDATWWNETLSDQLDPPGTADDPDAYVVDVRSSPLPGPYHNVTLELEGDETYTLQLARVGVGSNTVKPEAAYVTDVDGNGSSVPEGSTQQVVVEVRDRFNNPVADVRVNASVATGSLKKTQVTTDGDGRAVFTYNAPDNVDNEVTVRLNTTFEAGVSPGSSSFDHETQHNVTSTLFVQDSDGSGGGGGGGGGAYSVDWRDPSGKTGVEEPCDDEACSWNLSKDTDSTLTLSAETSPTVENLDTELRVNNSSVARVVSSDADTGTDGVANATIQARANGMVKVYVITGDSSDLINVTVTNASGNLPPTADFVYSPSSPYPSQTVEFDPTASSDPEGNVSQYRWDFDGDGTVDQTTSSATNVTYTYADSGSYDVNLTVVDNASNTDTSIQTVTVQNRAPNASFTSSCTALNCSFDASGSTDGDGNIVSYDWEFGDGSTGTDKTTTHNYSSAGTYTVNLTVTDDDGATNTTSKTILVSSNTAPTADIYANETTVETGETISFNGLNSSDSDGFINRYEWSFGDGSPNVTGSSVTHSYADDGTYTVELTVKDDNGATNSTSVTITVNNRQPTANFTYSPIRPIASNSVSFDASNSSDPDGSISKYQWDWDGDGNYETTTTSSTTSHTVATTGSYNVTLRVVDDDGDATVTNETVQVIGGRIGVTYVTSTASGNQLRAIDKQGRITTFDAGGSIETAGPATADLDGDGLIEATYVTGSGYIKLIDRNNETQTLLNAVSAKKSAIAVGSWRGSPTSVFFANNNDDDAVYRKTLGGSRTEVANFSGTSIKGVIGIGDVDGDDNDEIAVLTGSNTIGVVDDDGNTYIDEDGLTVASSSGTAVGPVGDYNGDGDDRIATIDGSNQVRLVECNFKATGGGDKLYCNGGGGTAQETVTLTPAAAKKAPFGAANWTGDSTPEVIYAENKNSPAELYYAEVTNSDTVGTESHVNDEAGSRVTVVVSKGVGNSALSKQASLSETG